MKNSLLHKIAERQNFARRTTIKSRQTSQNVTKSNKTKQHKKKAMEYQSGAYNSMPIQTETLAENVQK